MKTTAAILAAFLLCMNAFAGELDLSFNADAFRFIYGQDFKNNNLAWDAGLLNNSDKGYVVSSSLYLTGFASDGSNPLEAGLGGRTGYVNGDNSGQTGIPLAIGGYLKYTLPDFNRVSIRGDAFYAPDILTIMDLDKYEDYTLKVSYSLMHEAEIYVGVRYVKAEFDNNTSQLIDNGMHLGIDLRF
ncbi:MAG: hypothetical protein GY727_02870 [Gammaproteobacteria bacterium]|nr:hypothetical protein [Gammaproteobacteria bacterium]MCP4090639.1 hypothetical protein [Gammaproteobacteria bacterium]MCP4275970.1 hypothetical protein [Gammaproteobacteria bacterium]MCP4832186.1 hypothetical protein [Gammaproteobacteria bacterium]MCP4928177.1 hypothetical protein [Gammaproteobacteria bacterium]